MTELLRFVLDTNVFVEAARRYYAFDIAPKFWSELVHRAAASNIISIDRVKGELARGNDDLAQWANGQFHPYFASTADQDVINAYGNTWYGLFSRHNLARRPKPISPVQTTPMPGWLPMLWLRDALW